MTPGAVEAEARRPSFRGDVPVILCDGQQWYLPRPRLRAFSFRPRGEDGNLDLAGVTDLGAEYDFRVEEAWVASLKGTLKATDVAWLARALLAANYDLSERDYYALLQLVPVVEGADPEAAEEARRNQAMWAAIWEVAGDAQMWGTPDPKAPTSSDGSGTPSSSIESTPTA